MGRFIDLTGQKFGRLTVVERHPENKKTNAQWHCICDCGNVVIVASQHLRRGESKSCGCLHDEQAFRNLKPQPPKHGMCRTSLYKRWQSIKDRCLNSNNPMYHHYGGRGITVCEEWRQNFDAFREWAMANGYRDDLTIDRIDNNGNYEPANCRWITNFEQQSNRRNNHNIQFNGETHTLTEWARITGITPQNIKRRLKNGWSLEKTLTTPAKKYRLTPKPT